MWIYQDSVYPGRCRGCGRAIVWGIIYLTPVHSDHSIGEYARGAAHTNSIESVWAVLKRGIMGVYHSTSAKHLPRYVDEFTFRLNEGNVKIHTLDRLDSFVAGTADKRLTYKGLIQ